MATKVLITGIDGLIGRILRRELEVNTNFEISGLGRRPMLDLRYTQADIADLQSLIPAFQGHDVVVHLAAYLRDDNWEGQLNGNIIGVYNVYEAARIGGVKRVVFASSGHAACGCESEEPYSAIVAGRYNEVPPMFQRISHETVCPSGIYGAAKVWGEVLGRHFMHAHGLSVLCVRIGSVRPGNRPRTARERSIYLSHDDVAQVLRKCIEAPLELRYGVFFATSNNKWGYRDIEYTRKVLGYSPKDSADTFEEEQ